VEKNENLDRNEPGPVRMALLENFGAEPFIVKLGRSNCNSFVGSLRTKVAQAVMTGIPKFRKESHPERANDSGNHFFAS
jgi:hypothetical protein